MSRADLQGEISSLFNPEVDEHGFVPGEWPHSRLEKQHKLDVTYLKVSEWKREGTTVHKYTRKCSEDDKELHTLDRNLDVPLRLLEASLRLFGDSIVSYHDLEERRGFLRFYPPVILTAWSGFEAFIKYTSELLLLTVRNIPDVVKNYLQEQEIILDHKKNPIPKFKIQKVLERYAVLLKYGYDFDVNRGDTYWQNLEKAYALRNYYTHLGIKEARSISSAEVLQYLENVLLGIIVPSCKLQRTLLSHIYFVYDAWAGLNELAEDYVEEPLFVKYHMESGYLFHCNFENIDDDKFPTYHESLETI